MEIQGDPLSQEFLNFPGQSTWTSVNKPFKFLFFYTFILTWNAFLALLELLVVFIMNFCHIFVYTLNYTQLKIGHHFCYFLKHVIGGRTPRNINYEPCMGVHVNFLQQIWVFIFFEILCYFKLNFLVLLLDKNMFSNKHQTFF